jgi:hypothetical protein
MGLMEFSNDTPNNCDGLDKNFELNLKHSSMIIKFSMYQLKMWNPTNVLDHIADVMTYVGNIEDEGHHSVELDPTTTRVACTV